jgi:hypothetical protein
MRGRRLALAAMLSAALAGLPAQSQSPRTSRIVGIVIDSIHSSGLAGADVMITGSGSTVTTDSLGRFVIDSVAPGTYQVGVFHPLLESLGLTLTTKPFTVGRDSVGVANLAIPSATTIVTNNCGSEIDAQHPAAVLGRVQDPDTDDPVAGAAVSLSWVDLFVSKETGVVRTPHELHSTTNKVGVFKFCGLPMDLDGTVQASRAGIFTGEVAVSTNGAPLTFENLTIAEPRPIPATGVVRGIVVGLDDRPVQGARVEAPMTGAANISKDDGSFALEGLPTGTQLLVVRRVGFEPARVAVNITSRQPTVLNVVLGPRVNVMDPVLVTARRNYALEKVGFAARQKTAWGTFFTHDDIEKRNAQRLSDMLRAVPGISVLNRPGGATVVDSRQTAILGGGRGGSGGTCPKIWVDGTEWRAIDPGDLDNFVFPSEVVGMEVYARGHAPSQYRGIDECIVIVVWTQSQNVATVH